MSQRANYRSYTYNVYVARKVLPAGNSAFQVVRAVSASRPPARTLSVSEDEVDQTPPGLPAR